VKTKKKKTLKKERKKKISEKLRILNKHIPVENGQSRFRRIKPFWSL